MCLHGTASCARALCHADFDYRQSMGPREPGAWYAVLPLEQVYAFDPVPQPQPPLVCLSSPLHPQQSCSACGLGPDAYLGDSNCVTYGEARLSLCWLVSGNPPSKFCVQMRRGCALAAAAFCCMPVCFMRCKLRAAQAGDAVDELH